MRNYQKITKIVNDYSEEKVEHAISGLWNPNAWLIVIFFIFVYDFLMNMLYVFGYIPWICCMIMIIVGFFWYIQTCRMGIGLTNNTIMYIRFSRFRLKPKDINQIQLDKIKYIDVRRQFGNTYVRIHFISETGKLKKIKFAFSKVLLGSETFRKNSLAITERLVEIQKIVDKGDF